MTYGDGLSNINLKKLISFHYQSKSIATFGLDHQLDLVKYIKRQKNKFKENHNLKKFD